MRIGDVYKKSDGEVFILTHIPTEKDFDPTYDFMYTDGSIGSYDEEVMDFKLQSREIRRIGHTESLQMLFYSIGWIKSDVESVDWEDL